MTSAFTSVRDKWWLERSPPKALSFLEHMWVSQAGAPLCWRRSQKAREVARIAHKACHWCTFPHNTPCYPCDGEICGMSGCVTWTVLHFADGRLRKFRKYQVLWKSCHSHDQAKTRQKTAWSGGVDVVWLQSCFAHYIYFWIQIHKTCLRRSG